MLPLLLIIMVKVLTVNVRGIKGIEKQTHLALYAQRQRADILLLQETNLSDTAPLTALQQYHVIQNPAIQAGAGTAIALHTKLHAQFLIHSQQNLVTGYLQTCHITLNKNEFQLVNIYMPINTARATEVATILESHLETVPTSRTVIIGGDWNVTLAAQDRENHEEKRKALAQQIGKLLKIHNMVDVWRSFHPESNQFTYLGNQTTHPKSRLDRFYISKHCLHQTHSVHICPYFADHAGLSLNIITPSEKHRPAFWRFRNKHLNDPFFNDIATALIQYYTALATEQEDILHVWDKMKQEIKLQTQRFEEHQRHRKNDQYKEMERQIHHLTEKHKLTEMEEKVLSTTGTTLRNKYQQDARRRILNDYSSNQHSPKTHLPIFPNQSARPTPPPQLQTIKIHNTLLTEPHRIRTEVRKHYQELYTTKGNKPNIREDFFSQLPALEEEERERCEALLTINELTIALQNTNLGKAPGLDGLTYEFYKKFWKELSPLLLQVANTSLQKGKLPTSMLNGVVTLVPKQGDPTMLSNWRPITLLNTDYKIITRCLAQRITAALPKLITSDQSYCIPNRTIHTNLHLIRDSIDHANRNDLPLAIISLDQASAFDCIEHAYIFHVLEKFGFGKTFISYVRAIYHNAQGMVKINGSLTAPFKYTRGVRQGDPLSGPLFTLTIEPFLQTCNQNLSKYGIQLPSSNNRTLVTTAYADDVTVFLSQNEGLPKLLENFMAYGAISGAILNVQKTTGLFAGRWKHRRDRPLGFHWNGQGGKYLGVYLGNSAQWQQRNWIQLENKTQAILKQWEKIPHVTSYQDRKVILNQLVGAKLTHIITILPPTTEFLDKINKMMVSFIWQGRHWKHPDFVYGRLENGGIGVHHLPTRVQTLRFKFLQKFLANTDRGNAWHLQAHNIRLYAPDLQAEDVLKLHLNPTRFSVMPLFYASTLEAWHKMKPIVNPNIQSLAEVRRIPLNNSTLLHPHISGQDLVLDKVWSTLNVWYIGDLLTENGRWKHIEEINTSHLSRPTIRRLTANIKKAEDFIRRHYPTLTLQSNPSISTPLSYTILQPNGNLTPLPLPQNAIYRKFLSANSNKHVEVKGECHWNLGKPNWKAVYHQPILSQDGDIAWRILHNRIVTPDLLHRWSKRQTDDCPWCPGDTGTFDHMFFDCPSVQNIWARLAHILHRLLGPHPLHKRIIMFGYSNLENTPHQLANYLLVLAKTTIYKTYMATHSTQDRTTSYWRMFKLRFQYRIYLEMHYSLWRNELEKFKDYWLYKNIFGEIQNGKIILNKDLF
jgi:exonuclease III